MGEGIDGHDADTDAARPSHRGRLDDLRDTLTRSLEPLSDWERRRLTTAEDRRLSFVNRRDESVDQVRRMSRIVLVWPLMATVLSAVPLLATDNVLRVLIGLSLLYSIGIGRRRAAPQRKLGEAESAWVARSSRWRWSGALLICVALIVVSTVVHDLSPVVARMGGLAALFAHACYRYLAWQLDLFVLSTTALWRFQGLVDFKVSSLEYSKIQAGPNATSGMAAWLPIGTIEMDSAGQTGDLPMQRIGPVWGAEDLAVAIFQRRKRSGQRVRIVDVQERPLRRPRYPGSQP